MSVLKDCVVVGDKVYCWDNVRQKCVEAELVPKENGGRVPEAACKLIAMKRFGLVEGEGAE